MQNLFGIDIMQYLFGKKDSVIGGKVIDEHRARKRWEFSQCWIKMSTANSISCKLSFWIKGRNKQTNKKNPRQSKTERIHL